MQRRTVVRLLANDGVDQSEVWVIKKIGFRFGFKPSHQRNGEGGMMSPFLFVKKIMNGSYKNTENLYNYSIV